jgi:hypothetical protein
VLLGVFAALLPRDGWASEKLSAPLNTTFIPKDKGQALAEQRRNARRTLRAYVEDCRQRWPSLSEDERELCREAVRNLAERAGVGF